MRTVNEVSKITGVSIRTLHYYDKIGLLKPTAVTEAGYRLYDEAALCRLQNILLFRELQFPLKEIKIILDSPSFDPKEALTQQIKLLELQLKHIEKLISLANEIQEKGVNQMNFNAFDRTEINRYTEEVRERWGTTRAYEEYTQRSRTGRIDESAEMGKQLMDILAGIGSLRQSSPAEKEVQEKIGELQQFITENYYSCTEEILNGLGQMYVGDERMKNNIDKAGGAGTAEFVQKAISVYCSNKKR